MLEKNIVCKRFGVEPSFCEPNEKLGLAIETLGEQPIHGLRLHPENGTCGWYIWCGGEMSHDSDFFKPLCVNHVEKYIPEVESYLSLPPGYRFLIADDYEDVWFDEKMFGLMKRRLKCSDRNR